MQELNTTPEKHKRQYITLKISAESRAVLREVQNDPVWSRIDIKDIIAFAWPRCPACGGPLTVKFTSQNIVCVKCRAEYQLARI